MTPIRSRKVRLQDRSPLRTVLEEWAVHVRQVTIGTCLKQGGSDAIENYRCVSVLRA